MVSNIDETKPTTGIDQPVQVIRDNFTIAKIEITELQARKFNIDGTSALTGPLELVSFTLAELPPAIDNEGSLVYVSDNSPPSPFFSDGLTWSVIGAGGGGGLFNIVEDLNPQLGGALDAQFNKIVNLGAPTANTDAATKNYVDTTTATSAQGALADSALQNVVEDTNPQLGGNLDVVGFAMTTGGEAVLDFASGGETAVNNIEIVNGITGFGPIIRSVGADTNVDLNLSSKGTGVVNITGAVTVSSTVDGRDLSVDGAKLDLIEALADVTDTTNVNAAGAVMETDYNAQTILIAVADNTPLPVTVAASTFVGRKATGDVGTMTVAEALTLLNVEAGATADQTAADIRGLGFFDTTNDGTGSGLDADLLDGNEATAFATSAQGTLADSALQNIVEDLTPQLGEQLDVNTFGLGDGTNLLLGFVEDASAVNHIEIENEATGSGPIIRAAGADTNVDLLLAPKGIGEVQVGIDTANAIITSADAPVSSGNSGRSLTLSSGSGDGVGDGGDILITPGTAPGAGTDGSLILVGLVWPIIDGASGQAITTDGTGNLSFTTIPGTGLFNVIEDTTPQLGGALDVNGFNITMPGSETVDGRDLSVDGAKLDLIDANATADQTAADIRGLGFFDTTNDGTGTGLDADLLDGNHASAFATAAQGTTADSALQNVVEDTTPQLGGQLDVNTFGLGDGTNLLLDFVEDASAVNHIQIENEEAFLGPIIRSVGSDSNVDLVLETKGTGNIVLDGLKWPIADGTTNQFIRTDGFGTLSFFSIQQATGIELENIVEDLTPQLGGQLDVNTFGLGDGTNLLLDFVEDASAVNHIQIENEATGSGPIIRAVGTDTNIDLKLSPKGTGDIDVSTSKIINVTDPTVAQDAATKNYVDTQGFVKTSENNTYTKAQRGAPVAIASSATITPDFDAGNNFEIDTIATNFTLANPTNMTSAAGQSGAIIIVQDGTGSRLLSAAGGFWKFPGGTLPTLSTGIGAVDTITYYVRSSTFIVANVVLDAQ